MVVGVATLAGLKYALLQFEYDAIELHVPVHPYMR